MQNRVPKVARTGVKQVYDTINAKERGLRRQEVEPFARFAERIIRIRTMPDEFNQRHSTPLRLRPLQKVYWKIRQRLIEENGGDSVFVLLLKSRREGFTTLENADSYQRIKQRHFEECSLLGYELKATRRLYSMIKHMHDRDPERGSLEDPTINGIHNPETESYFHLGTAGSTSFGRGDTLTKFHGTEACFWKGKADDKLDLLAGLTEAATGGYGVLETTPKVDNLFYPLWKEAKEKKNPWYPIFIPWWLSPDNTIALDEDEEERLLDTLSDDERYIRERYGVSLCHLQWRRWKHHQLGRRASQEYPDDDESAWLDRGECYFDRVVLKKLRGEFVRDPKEICDITGTKIWHRPHEDRRYKIGADCSEGKPDGDWQAAAVMDDQGVVVATLHCKVSPQRYAYFLDYLASMYDAEVVVEKNNGGVLIIDRLANYHRTKKLFRRIRWDGRRWAITNEIGFLTDGTTREQLLSDLDEEMSTGTLVVYDAIYYDECTTFTRLDSGRYEGDPHDDMVFAIGLAHQGHKMSARTRKGVSFV